MTFLKKIKKIKNRNFLKVLISWAFVVIFIFLSPGRSVYAATEYMSFNLWDRYRNAIQIGMEYYYPDTGHNYQFEYAYTNNNSVTVKDNVTTIDSNVPITPSSYLPVNSSTTVSYINRITISTPSEAVEPVFYVSEAYLNKPITFSFQLTLTALNCEFWKSHGNNSPHMVLYLGSKDSYTQTVGTTFNSVWRLDSDTLYYKFDCTYTFTKTNFICGFWFSIYDPSSIGIYLNGSPNKPEFNASYTLSPLVFTNDITAEDIEDSVSSGIIAGTGGNNYDGFDNSTSDIFFDKEGAISEISNNLLKDNSVDFSFTILSLYPQLVSTMRGLSAFVDDYIMRLPFLRVTLYMSLGLGCLGFLLGLAQFVVSRPNTKTSSGKKQKGKKGD